MARIEQLTGRDLADRETRLDFLAARRAARAGPGLRVHHGFVHPRGRALSVGCRQGPRSVGAL
ncbi:hypothetical protein ACFW7J_37395 [Streptomyces sp. NPDC059525]|uniref:hypothetical protein n=1 Tax=Streptomyces sp. NPDC059525 TaxID=3346857 RepID=UPI0036B39132